MTSARGRGRRRLPAPAARARAGQRAAAGRAPPRQHPGAQRLVCAQRCRSSSRRGAQLDALPTAAVRPRTRLHRHAVGAPAERGELPRAPGRPSAPPPRAPARRCSWRAAARRELAGDRRRPRRSRCTTSRSRSSTWPPSTAHRRAVSRHRRRARARRLQRPHAHRSPPRPGAEARQSLRGLIEGAGAEIDLRPRLEIHTDEVRAQHGATTGPLDENLLFYLLARGIEREHRARAAQMGVPGRCAARDRAAAAAREAEHGCGRPAAGRAGRFGALT